MYKLLFSNQATKFIKSLDNEQRERIREICLQIRENPYCLPYKKVRGKFNTYRLRIGKFRIIYEVDKNIVTIYILKIDLSKKVYK